MTVLRITCPTARKRAILYTQFVFIQMKALKSWLDLLDAYSESKRGASTGRTGGFHNKIAGGVLTVPPACSAEFI